MQRTITLSYLILSLSGALVAQNTLQLDWQTAITNNDGSRQMRLVAAEAHPAGTYVAGYRSTTDGLRMYTASHLANGDLAWERDLASDNEAAIRYMDLDGTGNVYVAGMEEVPDGVPPIHIARMNAQGDLVWHHTFDAEGAIDVDINWMTVTGSSLYLVGSEEGDAGYEVAWAASFTLDGELNWKTIFDAGTPTAFYDIDENGQGGIAACGSADSDYSHLLVGFSSDGSVSWSWPSALTGGDEAWMNDLTSDASGNWIVMATEEVGPFFEYDAVTFKFDANGAPLWNRHFNNGGENYGGLVEVAPNGNIIGSVNVELDFDRNVRAIAYDAAGTEVWATDLVLADNTTVVNAVVNSGNEVFIGLQDFDQLGVSKLSSTGAITGSITYDQEEIDYLSDIAVNGSNVFACGWAGNSLRSKVITLDSDDLQEEAAVIATGTALSDVKAGALMNNGAFVWVASCASAGDSSTYSISKLDASGNLLWTRDQRQAGSNPIFNILAHDAAGNAIGLYQNLINGGHTDLGLVKYDAAGNEVFAILYDSTATLRAGSITTDPANNVYVNGYNETTRRMWLAKYTPSGSLVWLEHYTSPSTTFPYAEAKRMVHTQQNKLVLGSIHKNAANVNNLYLFQYDADGNMEWQTEVGPASGNNCTVSGLNVDATGNITIFGSSGVGTYSAAAYNSTGGEIWSEGGSSTTFGVPRSLAVDAMGNAYLCFSKSTGAAFRKLNAAGSVLNAQEHALPSSGNFFFPYGSAVIGDRLAVLGDHIHPVGNVPFEMLLDDQLNLISGRVDSLHRSTFSGSDLDPNGALHAVFTAGEQGGGIGFRFALVRQYSIGSVGIHEKNDAHLGMRVRPNPMNGNARLICDAVLGSRDLIRILDLNGRSVREQFGTGRDVIPLDLGELAFGTYVVHVVRADGRAGRTLLVRE